MGTATLVASGEVDDGAGRIGAAVTAVRSKGSANADQLTGSAPEK